MDIVVAVVLTSVGVAYHKHTHTDADQMKEGHYHYHNSPGQKKTLPARCCYGQLEVNFCFKKSEHCAIPSVGVVIVQGKRSKVWAA